MNAEFGPFRTAGEAKDRAFHLVSGHERSLCEDGPRELDGMLASFPEWRTWRYGACANSLLFIAVQHLRLEMIAVLMYHGADPIEPCTPTNLSPIDIEFNHRHRQERERFHFLAALLNNGRLHENAQHRWGVPDGHLFGLDVDAPLPDFNPRTDREEVFHVWRTPLMYACMQGYPYCVRHLLLRRHAQVEILADGGITALFYAISSYPAARLADREQYPVAWRRIVRRNYRMIFSLLIREGAHLGHRHFGHPEAEEVFEAMIPVPGGDGGVVDLREGGRADDPIELYDP